MKATVLSRTGVTRRQSSIEVGATVGRHHPSSFRTVAALVLAVAVAGSPRLAGAQPAPVEPGVAATLTVMTYNLRYASASAPNAWSVRRPIMREVIQQIAPDVFGTQEGLYAQLKDLAVDLPEYAWIGLGREGGSRDEFMAVFYRTGRLEPLAFDHFWLSDTPEVIASRTWTTRHRRMVTWVRFLDRRTKQEFVLWNTHFDNEVQAAREKSAKLVRERVGALPPALPVILTGDFNAGAGANPVYATLTGDGFFSDTWVTAKVRKGEGIGTTNGFKAIRPNGPRIDWILTRGDFTVESIEIVTFSRDGQFPSDHFPVVTRLRMGAAREPKISK